MTTAAKPLSQDGSHWYTKAGTPAYEVQAKNGNMRPTTLADARKLSLVPSCTTILKVLHKQGLVDWMIEQACLTVLTAPRLDGEGLDAFVQRVLHTEKQQDQEAQLARDRGTQIHAALEDMFQGDLVDPELEQWCKPAYLEIFKRGHTLGVETCVVGDGYAGKIDLTQNGEDFIWIWDWKTTKKLPKAAWNEHVLQAAGYAAAYQKRTIIPGKEIRTGNVYISTVNPGEFTVCEHGDWEPVYEQGFKPLVQLWQFLNDYRP